MDAKDYLQYNLTIRLGSLLSLPSKFLHRLRRIDDLLSHDLNFQSAALDLPMPETSTVTSLRTNLPRTPSSRASMAYELTTIPGPFAFMTSGYALGLVALALVLNRIQHIVVPTRRSLTYRIVRSRRSILHALFYSFFPVDLSSTPYRLTLRIPSLYMLYKSLASLFLILLQVSGYFPSTNIGWAQALGRWAAHKEMEDVCWSIFGSVCTALVIGALTRGLEGFNSSNTQPFNIFGYAMLLHIYSMPVTHANRGSPSRPDTNVLLAVLFPLLQLTLVHTLGVKKTWARYRLVPTSICSLATIFHFNFVLLTKPSSYPMLNYLPCLIETILLLITILTVSLNALTQLLVEGEITRPLFGHTQTLAPKWDEDFAIALLRLGTASLEATHVVGLGNEVGSVSVGDSRLINTQEKRLTPPSESIVELNSAGVVSITNPVAKGRTPVRRGFTNEIKHVKIKNADDDWLIDHAWLRELTRFGLTLLAVLRGLYRVFLWLVWYRWKGVNLKLRPLDTGTVNGASDGQMTIEPNPDEVSDSIYQRFLRGEDVGDDEDDEYDPLRTHHLLEDSRSYTNSESDGENNEETETENDDSDGNVAGLETVNLYSDLLSISASSSSVSSGPVLVAHMTAGNSLPLTRRRYNQLVSRQDRQHSPSRDKGMDGNELAEFTRERRVQSDTHTSNSGASTQEFSFEGRMHCVICTSEPREIICWPCKCLALCNDCRENLASRVSSSKHSCPCCRRSVDGYSRIYIP